MRVGVKLAVGLLLSLQELQFVPRKCFYDVGLRFCERNAVHVLATDAHDNKFRIPILSKARDFLVTRFGAEVAKPSRRPIREPLSRVSEFLSELHIQPMSKAAFNEKGPNEFEKTPLLRNR